MKFCRIVPTAFLEKYASGRPFQMALAHMVNKDPVYCEFYRKESDRGAHVIMDNSAFEFQETGRGVSYDAIFEAFDRIHPTEVIATDILFDGEATVKATKKFISEFGQRYPELIGETEIMAVPQGKTVKEWCDCAWELSEIGAVTCLGVSKLAAPMAVLGNSQVRGGCSASRPLLVNWLYDNDFEYELGIHLLGSDNAGALEMMSYGHSIGLWNTIRSNDSSMPFVYGMNKQLISEHYMAMDEFIPDRLDFGMADDLTERQHDSIEHNFAKVELFEGGY